MRPARRLYLIPIILFLAAPAAAQVEKVAMTTTGISCGVCAAMSEIYLRQLKTIDQIAISLSKEAVIVTYKSGAVFQPQDLRQALMKTDVGVMQFQIRARGRVRDEAGKRFFLADKDRFALVSSPAASQVAANVEILVEGIVDDKTAPMNLKILAVKTVK